MPHATRKMCEFAKKAINNNNNNNFNDNEPRMKIRELPIAVDIKTIIQACAQDLPKTEPPKTSSSSSNTLIDRNRSKSNCSIKRGSGNKNSATKISSTKALVGKRRSPAETRNLVTRISQSSAQLRRRSTAMMKKLLTRISPTKASPTKLNLVGCSRTNQNQIDQSGGKKLKSADNNQKKSKKSCSIVKIPGFDYDDMSFDERQVKFTQALLRSNVRHLAEMIGAESIDSNRRQFEEYQIENRKLRETTFDGLSFQLLTKNNQEGGRGFAKIYDATNRTVPKAKLICKQFDARDIENPTRSFYLRVLRHLGKKHPYVLQTWDIFHDHKTIYIFQEMAPYGNLAQFCGFSTKSSSPTSSSSSSSPQQQPQPQPQPQPQSRNNPLNERQAQHCAYQLCMALDFLGDMAICHLAIRPENVLVMRAKVGAIEVKLTGFRSAILYYDERRDDIRYQPCIPLEYHRTTAAEQFYAPECYGDPDREAFDPTTADLWSFGATIFYSIAARYPYNVSAKRGAAADDAPKSFESEIQQNIRSLRSIDRSGQNMLGHCLTTLSTSRFSIEKIKCHPWLVIGSGAGVAGE